MGMTQPGDVIVVDHALTWDSSPLISVGRTFRGPDPFTLASFPTITADPATEYLIDQPQVALRSAQGSDGTWYGGQVIGLDIIGPNTSGVNGRMFNGRAHGIWVDSTRPHPELCAATLCRVRYSWIDLMYGPGTTLACLLQYAGRMGRTMHFDGAQLLLSVVDHVQRAYALETPHRRHGIVIDGNTFGGGDSWGEGTGYLHCPVGTGAGYTFGAQITNNHSTAADVAAGTIDGMASITWAGRFPFGMGELDVSYAVTISNNTFDCEAITGHIHEKIQEPGLWVENVNGLTVENNTIPCLGPFVKLTACTNTNISGNNGGEGMTAQAVDA